MALRDAVEVMMSKLVVTDTRQKVKVKYPLLPTLFGIIIAWVCGNNSCVAVADYWEDNRDFLKESIPGFPDHNISHDTVNRLLSVIKMSELQDFLMEFCRRYLESIGYDGIRCLNLDGQTNRALEYESKLDVNGNKVMDSRTYDRLYYVTLYDSTNGLALAQDEVQDKENENKCCIRLIEMFDLSGCIVTCDALNTQRSVAEAIIKANADYCLALKDNHKTLRKAVSEAFANEEVERNIFTAPVETAHGRIEQRSVVAIPASAVKPRVLGEWAKDARTFFYAVTESNIKKYDYQRAPECRLFISSLEFDNPNIAELGYRAIREHWGIENKLHWTLDMDFGQDRMQMKNRNLARNKVLLNKLSLNVLKTAQPSFSKKSEVMSISRLIKKFERNPKLALDSLSKYFIENNGQLDD